MLEEQTKPFGCLISTTKGTNSNYRSVKLKSSLLKLDEGFIWLGTLNDLETTLKTNLNRLMAVLINGGHLSDSVEYDCEKLLNFIDTFIVRLTPDSKLNTVLEYINLQTTYNGQSIALKEPTMVKLVQLYFYNLPEWRFYLKTALNDSYITRENFTKRVGVIDESYYKYMLTIKGLSRLINVSEGKNSNYCFVAMAFTPDMFIIAEETLKPALIGSGFKYYSVSEEHIQSDVTINDAILAGIKKAHFTIADFTHHRPGVYFEAGYALGRGQKVIYTCREDEMSKAHFDIRNYQHIVWTDANDFKRKLSDKIEAFIKD